ncbi:hypothetical protein Tco_0934201 [Tanacetum coccineum]
MSGRGSDQKASATCPEVLNPDVTDLDHQEGKSRKGRRRSEGWKRVYSIGWVIKKGVCPHTPVVQGDSHITATEEKPKAITRVPAQGERSPLLRGITIEEHTRAREEGCQKVRIVQEDTRSLNLRSKGQVWRTCPNHGYVRKLIRSLHASAILIYQKGSACLAMSKRMTGVKIRKIISKFSRPQPRSKKSVDEMMKITTTFLRGEVAAGNQERKKAFQPWK